MWVLLNLSVENTLLNYDAKGTKTTQAVLKRTIAIMNL